MTKRIHGSWNFGLTFAGACVVIVLLAANCSAQQIDSLELQIAYPKDGTVVNPGQTFSVVVAPASSVTLTNVSVIGTAPIGSAPLMSAPPFQFSITVPTATPTGKYNLTAWAIDGQGQTVVSIPIKILVESAINPVAISAQSGNLIFEAQGQQLPLTIKARFPGGSLADVTESSLLGYTSSDPNVVAVDGSGIVTAVGPGSASVLAVYGGPSSGLSVAIPVTVLPSALTSSPTSLSFGIQTVGTTSPTQPLTLTNSTKHGLRITAVKANGEFSETDNCISSSPLPAGASCTINVSFAPTGNDSRKGAVNISNSFNVVPVAIPLTGIGAFDTTPPVTAASLSPQPNSAGWNNSDVTVKLSSTDNELGGSGVKQINYGATGARAIASTVVNGASATFAISTEGITTITFFGTDNVGNVESAHTLTVQLDKTPPLIKCGTPDGIWHASDVSIPCTASDSVSGLASPPDASFSLSTSVPAGTETSNAPTGTRSVCDVAGNCANAGPITGNMVDKRPPTIAVSSPTSGSYLLNQAVNANYSCTDGGSGVATCVGTVASASPISTAPVGNKTFTVNATDNVGNVAPPQTVSYSVTYAVCLLYDPTRAVQSGSTLPLKIQLCDANNADVSSSNVVVHAVSLVQTSTNASEVIQASGNANPDNDFRFDPTLGPTGGYIFNLGTKGLTTGSYQLSFTVSADPIPHTLTFQVR